MKVTLDGTVLTQKLDGTAFRADPGTHTAVLEVLGQPAVTRTLVIAEGDKGRRERVVVAPPPVAPPFGAQTQAEGWGVPRSCSAPSAEP